VSKSLPELPPFRVPGSPDHINDHDLLDEWLAAVKDAFYKGSGYSFPAIPDPAVHGNPGHVEAHNRLRACAEYMKATDYASDSSFPPIPAEADEGEQGHVVAHNEFRDVFAYVAAHQPSRYNAATGGTVTTVENYNGTGQRWRVHTFTGSGTFTVTTADQPFRVLVLGGGGGAGGYYSQVPPGTGGGGGAWHDSRPLTVGAHAVTIGAGGGGASGGGAPGGSTSLGDLTAGGGGGGARDYGGGSSGSPQSVAGGYPHQYGVGTAGTKAGDRAPLTSDITGSAGNYGSGGGNVNVPQYGKAPPQPPNTGNGGNSGQYGGTADDTTGGDGGSGIVVVAYQIG